MKLTEPNTKIKVNESNLKSFTSYLHEILINSNDYLNHLTADKFFKKILLHNLKTIYENACKIQFKNFGLYHYKGVINLSDAERQSLVKLFTFYPLPLDINFIEYELTKKLLK